MKKIISKKINVPNAKTLKAMKDAVNKSNLIAFKDKEDFYKKMLS